MLVSDFDEFVRRTDQYSSKTPGEREEIALYGLVGEIGSLVSAVKKQLLSEGGNEIWSSPNEEIIEEIGDIIWYCFSLAQISNQSSVNVLTISIAAVRRGILKGDERSGKIIQALDPEKREAFLKASESFPNTAQMEFHHYQNVAFLTARTDGRTFLEVCLLVLWQLGAELMRRRLPSVELNINRTVADRQINKILGEIAWHVSAICCVYKISLDDVVERNRQKVTFRRVRNANTPLHDEGCKSDAEKFPRKFSITFVTIERGRSRMYLNGRQVGDDLTDNAYDNDGYRFHDVMHLANVAKLGWSPVLRNLMGRKRKYDPRVDEVEDGARAKIVEELVVKAIHSEGVRLLGDAAEKKGEPCVQLFSSRGDVTFKFLKMIKAWVAGLEVVKNQAWEWEDTIVEGSKIFHALRLEGQGTVSVDLEKRSIEFSPKIDINFVGAVVGMGSAGLVLTSHQSVDPTTSLAKEDCIKNAVFDALEIPSLNRSTDEISLSFDVGKIVVRLLGKLQEMAWARKVLAFRIATSQIGEFWTCTAMALADPKDLLTLK